MKQCNSCGKCCIKYSNGDLSASKQDIEIWQSLRPDIYRYVQSGEIWIDPDSKKYIELCPWLRKDSQSSALNCAIYFDRPEDCRVYPSTVSEMIADECEMLEQGDLYDLKAAQATLENKFKT